ncbi:MAG: malto-oligosyltrehalose synthase [Rhodospirillales bacterium]|nr:malto-oligosyltrehalose synthase [Rhodospirillales bacterium]
MASPPIYPETPRPDAAHAFGLNVPRATYRLQFNRDFTFADATRLLPYLDALGVSHVYASPYLKVRPGSVHGYDVTDHNALNPELGAAADFDRFCAALAGRNMGQILDFVPNHMGIGKADNEWWLDVLEWGEASPCAAYFDIDWMRPKPALRGRVLLPFLGDHYGVALEAGELALRFDAAGGTFSVWYHDHRFPVRPRDYGAIIRHGLAAGAAGEDSARRTALTGLADRFSILRAARGGRGGGARVARVRADELKAELAHEASAAPEFAAALEACARSFAGQAGRPNSFKPLHRLLERQCYRLAFWRVAADEINYRRFFDINDLAGIRMENAKLFEACHRLVGELIAAGRLHGLRIDHIDGMFDPRQYCRRLQDFARRQAGGGAEGADGAPFYVVVEKILAHHERLRDDWPVAGTTGYEFLSLLTGLFVDPAGEPVLDRAYRRFAGEWPDFDALLYECKKQIVDSVLASEMAALAAELDRISEENWRTRDYTEARLRTALTEVVAYFPVYRTYVTERDITATDRRDIDWAVKQAKKRWIGPDVQILDFMHSVLTTDLVRGRRSGYRRADVWRFAMRFQQYTGPAMAKSLEDTAFYRFNRFLAVNEVGGHPAHFAVTAAMFHRQNHERMQHWPHSMLATATHDTKRGEDARMRIAVLSEDGRIWGRHARRWAALNRYKRRIVDDAPLPARNDEYLIYQGMVGVWPAELTGRRDLDTETVRPLVERLQEFLVKALREAKRRSSWTDPNLAYESGCTEFVARILDVARPNPFLDDFVLFQPRIAICGALNSLSQTVLKLTAPGVPDIYRGTELWDLSLVDPDNRRPVDFGLRERLLASLPPIDDSPAAAERIRGLIAAWPDGRIKLHLIAALLRLRREEPELFAAGTYEPLDIAGPDADRIVAFVRRGGDKTMIVAIQRFFFKPLEQAMAAWPSLPVPSAALRPPSEGPATYRNILAGGRIATGQELPAAELFGPLTAAVLVG